MALAHNPTINRTDLTIYADSGNVKSYDGSGTIYHNLMTGGASRNFVLSNISSLSTIDGVSCFKNNATGEKIVLSGYTWPTNNTLIGWARMTPLSSGGTWRTLYRLTDHPVIVQVSTGLIGYYDNDAGTVNSGFVSYGLNASTLGLESTWAMYSIVTDGTDTTLYINDGSSNATVTGSSLSGQSTTSFGSYQVTATQNFGYVGAFIGYERQLTQSEISEIFHVMRIRYGV